MQYRVCVRANLVRGAVLVVGPSALALSAFAWSGCHEAETSRRVPTYSDDVAPILMNNCAGCHHPGGIAPFSLLTFDQARSRGRAIVLATKNRTMPPFNLDNSGACNTYVEARWLRDDQIATLAAWVEAGAPVGDPEKAPPPVPPPPTLDRVDLTIDMGTAYTPDATRMDDYRCFVLDPGLREDRFITGFQIHPGEERMVHHLTLFALDTPEQEAEAAALDAAEPGPGYTCFGDTRVRSRWLVGSGPGGGALLLPEGTGLPIHAGRKMILQMHYNRLNGLFADRTKIDLKLAPSVREEAFVARLPAFHLHLPPRTAEVSQSEMLYLPESITVWGVWPHMHMLGSKLNVTATHEGRDQCLAQVNRWDFHWQGFADYTTPIHLSAGDAMRITCTYNTLSRDTPTTWGEGTMDEMCVAFLYVTPAP